MNRFLAGVGRALLIRGNNLIGVANTLTDSTFDFSVTSEDVRAGAANMLWGRYFHDSTLNVTLTDAMFRLEYMAAVLGTNIQSGGLSIKEEQRTVSNSTITASETPVATGGVVIGWYKLPTEDNWKVGTFYDGNKIYIVGATNDTVYCLKYFYENENARSITINANYIPSELHLVIINDLFNGDIANEPSETTKIGRLITDIPRFQLDGSQNLSLTSTGVASMSLAGSALAVTDPNSCEGEAYYGTMTEEIFGETWQDRVVGIYLSENFVEVAPQASYIIEAYVLFKDGSRQLKKGTDFDTFVVQEDTDAGRLGVDTDGNLVALGLEAGTIGVDGVRLHGYDGANDPVAYVTISTVSE